MKSTRSIFTKQLKDTFKNPMVLVNFLLFPVIALIMTELIARPNYDIPNNMFISMMSAIFSGMGLITVVSTAIAEDIENKSLRFLIMAGVKPHQYLFGVVGFFLLAGTITSIAFGLIGDFTGTEIVKFLIVMVTGSAASIILGAAIGMLSKNQQAAVSLGMPISMIVGFTPLIATFNETVENIASVLYTQQINVIINDFSIGLFRPILVIVSNIAVFTALFIIAYRKKGLK